MGFNMQQWATIGNNEQQWTTIGNNGQQSGVLYASLMPFFPQPKVQCNSHIPKAYIPCNRQTNPKNKQTNKNNKQLEKTQGLTIFTWWSPSSPFSTRELYNVQCTMFTPSNRCPPIPNLDVDSTKLKTCAFSSSLKTSCNPVK